MSNDDRQHGEERDDEMERGHADRRDLSAEEIILGDLVSNASRSSAKLKELLAGTILINLFDSGKRYLLDASAGELKAQSVGKESTADCTILVSEENLKRIWQGDLNPQIAMLSEKIRIQGRKAVAIYLFNLIAPRAHI